MKRCFSLWVMFTCFLILSAQTKQTMNHYEQQWQTVSEFEKKSLPKSAAGEVDKILRRAIADKNNPQVIKALIHQGKYDLALDAENDTLIFHHLNEMTGKSSDVVEKSVLHSMLGELYLQYYQKDRWTIDQRTALTGFVPSDMKEWTKNIFYDKTVEHLNASVAARLDLEKAAVEPYAAVVELGKDSRRFYPTMFDFLALRAIGFFRQIDEDIDLSRSLAMKNISQESLFASVDEFVKLPFDPGPSEYNLWALESYRRLLSSLFGRNLDRSVVLTELNKVDYLKKWNNAYNNYALPSLEKMLQKWQHADFSVEIVDRMADLYGTAMFSVDIPDAVSDNIRKENTARKELYELLQRTIRTFPEYERISILENRLGQLTQPFYTVTGDNTFTPGGEKKLKITYQNLPVLTARLYRLETPLFNGNYSADLRKNEKKIVIKEIAIPLPQKEAYLSGETEFLLDVKEYGGYKLEFEPDKEPSAEPYPFSDFYFSVSDLAAFARSPKENTYEFFVVDRRSGNPVKDAKIEVYAVTGNWNNRTLQRLNTIPVNELGLAVLEKNGEGQSLVYQAVSGKDNGGQLTNFPYSDYWYSGVNEAVDSKTNVGLFTDRSIYRPGQTVYFKAVVSTGGDNGVRLVTNKEHEITLYDANRREISARSLKTNEFGSLSGEFVLPQGLLPGSFYIEAGGGEGAVHFRVEEYKRPTFEITFDKIDQTYTFGEEITLKGKAENFSGVKLQNAVVQYRITRQQAWWWRWGAPPEHFTEGVVTTGENGDFFILFTPQKTDSGSSVRSVFTFSVEATVTDVNGESQTGTYAVTVGDVSMMLNVAMPDKWEKNSSEEITVTAKNLDGTDISAKGTYQVFSLQENDSIRQEVLQGSFTTGSQPELAERLKTLSSGKYRIRLQSKDDRGNDVDSEKDFILFSYSDRRPPITTNDWLIEKNKFFSPDKNAEIILGVSDKVNVLYEIWQSDNLLERKRIGLNNENRLFSIPYKPEYKDGVILVLTYVKDEKFYSHRIAMVPEKEAKGLNIKLDVFRDKIRPGSQEEWRISVKDPTGKSADAEILASMYDFSLDKIYPGTAWVLDLSPYHNNRPVPDIIRNRSFEEESVNRYFTWDQKTVLPFVFDQFNWYGFSLYRYGTFMIRGTRSASVESVAKADGVVPSPSPEQMALNEVAVVGYGVSQEQSAEIIQVQDLSGTRVDEVEASVPQVRRNFNETAFFYPQLRTNADGETQIAFTVPESNTRWRFRVLAHDKNLNTGTTEIFTVSQKELMVTPNMPRFLRHGDRTGISTKISNLSENTVNGNIRIEFFHPVTDEVITNIPVENHTQAFSLAKDVSSDASWTFDVPTDIDILGVRVVAESESFSDGEQHVLAVLPNRMLVTESMRMDVNGNQTKEFTMDRLAEGTSGTIQDYRLTLEFTSNPAWYAIQALPVLSNPESDNAVSWFASYYANTLGYHISQAYPKVSAMIEAWKKQGGDKETFLSNLEKNQELKNVLLEETPWVLAAKNESEQKEQLSLLFDLNRSTMLTGVAIDKLRELQTTDGGWSWFKGFRSSVGITQYILYGFNRLKELKATTFTDEIRAMQAKAVSFVDSEALRRFEELKKWNKDWKNIKTIPAYDLEYLYVRSAYIQYALSDELKEMTDFYTSVIEKNWTQYGLYERSLIAVLMQRQGKGSIVQDILKSYREHAVINDETGMFWANNRSHVFMSQSAVSVHTFIMDAFLAGGAGTSETDPMKRWLLKQKQTQQWESTHASMDAVYALLSTGSDWFSSDGKTTITLGGKGIEPEHPELGTGYFKESWSRSEIMPEMGNITVRHQGNAPAWGALYWQYFEDMDKITKTDASLDVEKLLFVEQTGTSGTSLVPVTKERPLNVGDKVIIRLTVRTDRDIEFVHLKDMRAACFEPVEQISGIRWQSGILYYQTSKDASSNFYFDHLPRGTYVFEYSVFVNRTGEYSNGITTMQCLYAPEFTSHTAGIRINVKE